MKAPVRAFTIRDVEEAERLYAETSDPAYIVLAIGANCNEPPIWALEAAQLLAKQARSASLTGNNRVNRGDQLDAIHRALFRIVDDHPTKNRSTYKPPSLRSVILAVLGHDGGSDISKYESELKALTNVWKEEAEGYEPNGQGSPENPRWHRIIKEDGDTERAIPYGTIIENYWKIERLFMLAGKNEKTPSRKKKRQLRSTTDAAD